MSVLLLASAAILAQSYTLHRTETLRPADGGPERVVQRVTIARRADGTRVEKVVSFPGQTNESTMRTIQDGNLRVIRAFDSAGIKRTGPPVSPSDVEAIKSTFRNPALHCAPRSPTARKSGSKTILGLEAAVFVVGMGEVGFAPKLGCEEVFFHPNRPDVGAKALTQWSTGEPDSALFDVSALREGTADEARRAAGIQ